MHIRMTQFKDYKEVYALWQACKGLGLNTYDDTEAGWQRFLTRNPQTSLVAEIDGKIVGVILAGHDGRRSYIYHMAVAPSHQRQGIGSALVRAAVQRLQKLGMLKVSLFTFAANTTALDFWHQMGFAPREDLIYQSLVLTQSNQPLHQQEVARQWAELYARARQVQNPVTISPFIQAGGVACALMTDKGNIYTGICIDTAASLGMCAERNAISTMLTNGETRITKLLALMPNGKLGAPCGACREFMMQLSKDSGQIEVLLDYDKLQTVRLEQLCPQWWTDQI